ncbi:MAG: DHH family phosphoesterase [Paludibacteraceae bacterium]|nr:DHH family phosphoesterase [Paludibacteraceae bacterium]
MISDKLTQEQVEGVRRLLEQAKKVVILTHMSPDGDAMGSALALYWWLKDSKTTHVIVPNAFPDFFNWMPGVNDILVCENHPAQAQQLISEADLIICSDFNEPKRIGQLGQMALDATCPKILIDHHLFPSDFADVTISYSDSPSASELVYRLIYQLGVKDLSLEVATCIYTGMMTDTGNFAFNSNHAEMYLIVAQLVAAGVDKDAVYNNIFNAHTEGRMRLVGYCLNNKMRVFPNRHAALIYVSGKELYRFNFKTGDAEGIVNMPMQIKDVYYSVFMREDKVAEWEKDRANGSKTKIKISMRSQGDRPVNTFCHDIFNGGGHKNASGGEYYGSLSEAVDLFLKNYEKYFKED